MKKDNWLVYLIIALTSTTTVLTMMDGTLFGFLRGVLFAFVLDGLIIYWEQRAEMLTDKKQRQVSTVMKWSGVGMLLAIAAAYAFTSLVPVDAVQKVDVFGFAFASTVRETIHWAIVGMVSLWVVLTLAVLMYVREIDPEAVKRLRLTEAHEEQERAELEAYKTALAALGVTVGTEKAIKRLRENLRSEGYAPVEVTALVEKAETQIKVSRGELVPVDMRQMHSETEDAVNFTKPSTRLK